MRSPTIHSSKSESARHERGAQPYGKPQIISHRPEAVSQTRLARLLAQDNPRTTIQYHLAESIQHSPRVVMQTKRCHELLGGAAQRRTVPPNGSAEHLPPNSEEDNTYQLKLDRSTELLQTKPKVAPNRTGLPDQLKSGVESLSGMSLDHVNVRYNSSQPKRLGALAFAQGNNIHLAPGQERHLPHEAWHVVQQAEGRVQPTRQIINSISINDDRNLEREADVMGAKAAQMNSSGTVPLQCKASATAQLAANGVLQRVLDGTAFTLALLQQYSNENLGLHSWRDFLAVDDSDNSTNSVHVHFYAPQTAEARVVVTGHAIWYKGANNVRCQQQLTVTATRNGDRWTAALELGDVSAPVANANPDLRRDLYDDVVNQLADALRSVLNED